MLGRIGPLIDLLEHRINEWGDLPHRRFFGQYRNGAQVNLVALPVSRRPGMPSGSVALYDPDGWSLTMLTPATEHATVETVQEWAFLA